MAWIRRALAMLAQLLRNHPETPPRPSSPPPLRRAVDVRITSALFAEVISHVENTSRGEEAGFLLCSVSRLEDRDVLLVREWQPVPAGIAERGSRGSVLSWPAEFNSRVLQHAVEMHATPVLVHSHGSSSPAFSSDDRAHERPLFAAFSRILTATPTGTVLLGRGSAEGSFWVDGDSTRLQFRRIVIIGASIETWYSREGGEALGPARRRLDRQRLAIGPQSDSVLAHAQVAVVGVSGGGSHVVQQLAHQGVGTIVAVDDQLLEETNLGRHVGATYADVDRTLKTTIATRVATGVDNSMRVLEINSRFPSGEAIAALKHVDVVVACLDRFDARNALNTFCRRYLIPLVDVGISIESAGERLVRADGQVIVSLPGEACLRCFFLTDALLAHERRNRPPGYDANSEAPGDPQVVSMNGTLASEACNCVLDLLTGYSGGRRGPRQWQYEGRAGEVHPFDLPPPRTDCQACAEEGFGDPSSQLP